MFTGKTKICIDCDTEKPVTDFPEYHRGKYGVKARCKPCDKKYQAYRNSEKPPPPPLDDSLPYMQAMNFIDNIRNTKPQSTIFTAKVTDDVRIIANVKHGNINGDAILQYRNEDNKKWKTLKGTDKEQFEINRFAIMALKR